EQALHDVWPAVPAVPRRDVQRAQQSELRAAAGEHPEHGLRHDHEHCQRSTHHPTGDEILLLRVRTWIVENSWRRWPPCPCSAFSRVRFPTTASSRITSRLRSPACRARIAAVWSPCTRHVASTR